MGEGTRARESILCMRKSLLTAEGTLQEVDNESGQRAWNQLTETPAHQGNVRSSVAQFTLASSVWGIVIQYSSMK